MNKLGYVLIGSARIDERGKASGGKAGDQTGNEVSFQQYYNHSKGWVCLRCIDPVKAEQIAQDMEWACANNNVGYDQNENKTLYNNVKPLGFDISKLTTPCETDCARLVRVCLKYADIDVADFYTGTEKEAILATGLFKEINPFMVENAKRGDILVTKVKGHTVILLTNGDGTYPNETEKLALNPKLASHNNSSVTVPDTSTKDESVCSDLGSGVGSTSSSGAKDYIMKVKVTADVLNVRSGPGTAYKVNCQIKDHGVYRITQIQGTWGKLYSGAGWISLKWTKSYTD